MFTIARSEFNFEPTGALDAKLWCNSIRRNKFTRWDWILLFVVYTLFTVGYTVLTIIDIQDDYNKSLSPEERLEAERRQKYSREKPWTSRVADWLGYDQRRLQD